MVFLCLMYFFNSMERGILPAALGAVMDTIQTETAGETMDLAQAGSLSSFFLIGLLLFLPVYTALHYRRPQTFLLLSAGMCLWLAGAIGSACCRTYTQFALCRLLSGAGAAALQVLGTPWVDANAPPSTRALWITAYMSMYGLGSSLGTVLAGQLVAWPALGYSWGWRLAYLSVAAINLPLVASGFFVDKLCRQAPRPILPPHTPMSNERRSIFLESYSSSDSSSLDTRPEWQLSTLKGLQKVLVNPLVMLSVFGSCALQAVIACVAWWTLPFMIERIRFSPSEPWQEASASLSFGIVMVAGIFVGTILGGLLLDALGRCYGGKSVALAFSLGTAGMTIGLLCLVGTYVSTAPEMFVIGLFSAIVAIMVGGAGFAPGSLWLVDRDLRVHVSALNVFFFNILGSVPGPYVVALLSPTGAKAPTVVVMVGMSCWLVWTVVLWVVVAIQAKRRNIGEGVDVEEETARWATLAYGSLSMDYGAAT